MKKLCTFKTDYIRLVDPKRKIFSLGYNDFFDVDGMRYEWEPEFSFAFENENDADIEEERSRREHISTVCGGLESFTDREIEWEIDDGFGNFGFKNQNGEVVIEPQYAYAHEFSHGLCPVNLGRTWYHTPEGRRYYENHYGYIDANGKTVIPFRFDEAESFNKYGVAIVSDDSGRYLIDTAGNEIAGTRELGLSRYIEYDSRFIETGVDIEGPNTRGLYDTKECQVLFQPNYGWFTEYDEDTIGVHRLTKYDSKEERMWIVNSRGECKYPWQLGKGFSEVEQPDEKGNSIVGIEENGVFRKEGRRFFKRTWYGVIDNKGEQVIPLEYERIWRLGELYACRRGDAVTVYEN